MWKYLVKQGPGTRMDAAAAANAAEETSMAARQQALQKDRDGPPPSMFSPATRHQQEDDRAQQRAAGGDLPPLQSPLRKNAAAAPAQKSPAKGRRALQSSAGRVSQTLLHSVAAAMELVSPDAAAQEAPPRAAHRRSSVPAAAATAPAAEFLCADKADCDDGCHLAVYCAAHTIFCERLRAELEGSRGCMETALAMLGANATSQAGEKRMAQEGYDADGKSTAAVAMGEKRMAQEGYDADGKSTAAVAMGVAVMAVDGYDEVGRSIAARSAGVARAEKAGMFIWAPVWPKLHEWVKAHPSRTVDWTAAEKHLRREFPDIPVGAFECNSTGRTNYSRWKRLSNP